MNREKEIKKILVGLKFFPKKPSEKGDEPKNGIMRFESVILGTNMKKIPCQRFCESDVFW